VSGFSVLQQKRVQEVEATLLMDGFTPQEARDLALEGLRRHRSVEAALAWAKEEVVEDPVALESVRISEAHQVSTERWVMPACPSR
jgi:hypothetical protein